MSAGRVLAVLLATVATLAATPVAAHETTTFGVLDLTLGWRDEPALSGVINAVELLAAADGAPVSDPSASLVATVSAGDARAELALLPEDPGAYRATIVPTRAGTYTFAVTGRVGGQLVDLAVECGQDTFDCVTDSVTVQVPPARATDDLAVGMERAVRRADRARDDAADAQRVARVAVVLAAGSIAVAIGSIRRGRSRAG